MHQQAQLRLKKDEIEKLGARAYVVVSMDLHRTRVFKEENLLLSRGAGPFAKEKRLVFATALSDPAGRAAALYGVARKCLRWGVGWRTTPPGSSSTGRGRSPIARSPPSPPRPPMWPTWTWCW